MLARRKLHPTWSICRGGVVLRLTYVLAYSEHSDFSESTEEIKPLTEEEKKAALAELREKAAARKALQAAADREEQKKNEVRIDSICHIGPVVARLLTHLAH